MLEESEAILVPEGMDNDEAINDVVFGEEVRRFRSSKVGKYIYNCAEIMTERAINDLLKVDPSKTEEVRKIQNEAKLGELVITWLEAAIQQGENAEQKILIEEAEAEFGKEEIISEHEEYIDE